MSTSHKREQHTDIYGGKGGRCLVKEGTEAAAAVDAYALGQTTDWHVGDSRKM